MAEHQQTKQSKESKPSFQKQAASIVQIPVSNPASIIQRARINANSLTPSDVLQLQRTIGNRAVGRLLSSMKTPSMIQQVPIQRQEIPEEEETLQGVFERKNEEETCPSCIQRQEIAEDEEPLQGKIIETVQREKIPEEEEKLQMKPIFQRQKIPDEDEPIQGKMIGTVQRKEIPEEEELLQKKRENYTGMPDNLKVGVESLSGIDMSDVRVHYNSSKPAEVGALAYTQGTNIHIAPGQERHLPHEAWHVVQQAQGMVRPTMQLKGKAVNDDSGLEIEADKMGRKAVGFYHPDTPSRLSQDQKGLDKAYPYWQPINSLGKHGSLNYLSPSVRLQKKSLNSDTLQPQQTSTELIKTQKFPQLIQRKTLAQAGRAGDLTENGDKTLVGDNLGPSQGRVYVRNLGNKETKESALRDSAVAYAEITTRSPLAELLNTNLLYDQLNDLKGTIQSDLPNINRLVDVDQAKSRIKRGFISPLVSRVIVNPEDRDLQSILDSILTISKKPTNEFALKFKLASSIRNELKTKVNVDWRANFDVMPVDPFLFCAKNTINENEFSIYYQHSPDWPGYVTYIEEERSNAAMSLGKLPDPDTVGIPNQFGRKHYTTGDKKLCGLLGLNPDKKRRRNERVWDSMTKLAAESARFICVRENISRITDSSRFYVKRDDATKYVTFEALWSSWESAFHKMFNIDNNTLITAILTGNRWTYGNSKDLSAKVLQANEEIGPNDVNLDEHPQDWNSPFCEIVFPRDGKILRRNHYDRYTLRVDVNRKTTHVKIKIQHIGTNGEWVDARKGLGSSWFFDWNDIEEGNYELMAKALSADNQEFVSRHIKVSY